jgi:hypothetical protein
MTVYLTADNHFGHARIMEYRGRPFGGVQEMVERWNVAVEPDDTVVHLGDFALASRARTAGPVDTLDGNEASCSVNTTGAGPRCCRTASTRSTRTSTRPKNKGTRRGTLATFA